jgi:alkylation response protein AidB-like acyl-CoA dehydrogenase
MTLPLHDALKQSSWQNQPVPHDAASWIQRADEVAAILAVDALERDRAAEIATHEVRLLKDAGLTTILGPTQFGGGSQSWQTALQIIQVVSAADASVGQLLGYHLLWAWAVRLVGTDDQIAAVEQLYTSENLFFGGAVNPRDSDLNIEDAGDHLVYTGQKSFSTGARVSDLVVLEGTLPDGAHVFAIVPTAQDGIEFLGNWDNLGQRLSESGGIKITGVEVDWAGAAGYVNKEFQPLVYNTLNVPLIQQIFTAIYLGIAEGALRTAGTYTRDRSRAWPYSTDPKDSASAEAHVLETYGDLRARLWAAQALAKSVDEEISLILHADREALTAGQRGLIAVRVAASKQVASTIALEVTNKIFEVTGARATSNAVGLDIYWRNIRTHSLHDPVAFKRREVGEYELLGLLPEPSWYT